MTCQDRLGASIKETLKEVAFLSQVSFGCWMSNPEVGAWMASHGMADNYTLLNNYYMTKLIEIIGSPTAGSSGSGSGSGGVMNKTAMFWRPGAADSLVQSEIPAGTIFDVYGSFRG
jgi:hypothetical protein